MMTMKKNYEQIPIVDFEEKNHHYKREKTQYIVKNIWVETGEIIEKRIPPDPDDSYSEEEIERYKGTESSTDHRSLIGTKVPDWNNIKTIHFHPSCTVPRFKLQQFCSKKKVKVIRDEDKADIILYGANFTNTIFQSNNNPFLKKTTVISRLKKNKSFYNSHTDIIPFLEASSSEYVIIEGYHNPLKKDKDFDVEYEYINDYDKYTLLTAHENKFYHQDNVLAELGTGAMDNATYRSLRNMFDSKDKANHVVAMEVMSNCNYQESIVYLLELMRRYYNEPIFENSQRNQVSFKALRLYLQYEPRNNNTVDELVENVIKKGLLTEANYNLIIELILEKVNFDKTNEDSYEGEDRSWILKIIDLAPEHKEKIIWNKKEEPQLTLAI